ncbi:MAG: hypothetical protein ACTSRA_02730, partial [Promethearchaeota archaeon]
MKKSKIIPEIHSKLNNGVKWLKSRLITSLESLRETLQQNKIVTIIFLSIFTASLISPFHSCFEYTLTKPH